MREETESREFFFFFLCFFKNWEISEFVYEFTGMIQ